MENTSIEAPENNSTQTTADAVINGVAVAAASAVVYVVVSSLTKFAMEKVAVKLRSRREMKLQIVK